MCRRQTLNDREKFGCVWVPTGVQQIILCIDCFVVLRVIGVDLPAFDGHTITVCDA